MVQQTNTLPVPARHQEVLPPRRYNGGRRGFLDGWKSMFGLKMEGQHFNQRAETTDACVRMIRSQNDFFDEYEIRERKIGRFRHLPDIIADESANLREQHAIAAHQREVAARQRAYELELLGEDLTHKAGQLALDRQHAVATAAAKRAHELAVHTLKDDRDIEHAHKQALTAETERLAQEDKRNQQALQAGSVMAQPPSELTIRQAFIVLLNSEIEHLQATHATAEVINAVIDLRNRQADRVEQLT